MNWKKILNPCHVVVLTGLAIICWFLTYFLWVYRAQGIDRLLDVGIRVQGRHFVSRQKSIGDKRQTKERDRWEARRNLERRGGVRKKRRSWKTKFTVYFVWIFSNRSALKNNFNIDTTAKRTYLILVNEIKIFIRF